MTDNHDYNTPTLGAQDWHVPLNENFTRLDTDVEVRDVEANLADYTPASGAKFLATDTEAVYLGDGSQWNRLATSGRSPTFDEVTAGTVTANAIDAAGYARGLTDGEILADDGQVYTDVQAAQDAAGQYLFVGPGTFGPLTVDTPGLVVEGMGRATVVSNADAPAIDIRADCTVRNLAHEVTSGAGSGLDNVFDGNASSAVDVTCVDLAVASQSKADAYHFESGGAVVLDNCSAHGVSGESVELAGVEAEIIGGRYERGRIKASSGATLLASGVTVVADSSGDLGKGFEFESAMGDYAVVTGCAVVGATRGAELQTDGCIFTDNRLVDCDDESIYLNPGQASSSAVGEISGNVMTGSPANGHWVTGSDGVGSVNVHDNTPPYA